MEKREIEVPGLETIQGFAGNPPLKIEVPFKLEKKQYGMVPEWNSVFIAIIPFCFKCREPLVWHTYPQGKTLYHCPKCGRQWVKGGDWSDDNS